MADLHAVLSVQQVTRRFGPVVALDGVTLNLVAGEVHGIIGENGAGKSTLMKIMSGVERPDGGEILINGKPVVLRRPVDAQRLGISMIHQELNLVEDLTVAENIFLGRETSRFGVIDDGTARRAAGEALKQVGSDVSPTAVVRDLSVAQKQTVEIAKAVMDRASVVIMDEPTAVLSSREVASLFELIRRLKRDGVAVVYISHLLPEVMAICDRVTVMRDGRVVGALDRGQMLEAGERGLASRMVGRPMADHFPKRELPTEEIAIRVENLTVPGRVNGVSFEVRRGEILGLAGLIGAGRTETAEAVCGLRKKSAGTVMLDGRVVPISDVSDATAAGLAYLSEDRKGTGLFLDQSIVANTTMASLKKHCRPLIDFASERAATKKQAESFHTRFGDIGDPVSSLSGGNQQKVALAKWLETSPRVLFVDEPTRGVDIGAKEQIYQLIQSLTRSGMACVLISSELNEVLGLAHRIAVMRGGTIVTVMDAADATEEKIMHAAAGVSVEGTG